MNNKFEFLRDVPIFSDLEIDTLNKIYKLGSRQIYKKEELIFQEDEVGSCLFFIIEGKVKIVKYSDDGREVILSRLADSDFFGEMALLDGLTRSASVVAIEDSDLFVLNRKPFLKFLKDYPEIAIILLEEITKRLRTANLQIKSLSLNDREGKVAVVLLQLAYDIGKIQHGIVEIENLPMQQEIAKMAATSRETVSRSISSMKKKGFIETDGQTLRILEYEKLKAMYM